MKSCKKVFQVLFIHIISSAIEKLVSFIYGQICNRHPPFGSGIADSIKSLPKYEMAIDQKVTSIYDLLGSAFVHAIAKILWHLLLYINVGYFGKF